MIVDINKFVYKPSYTSLSSLSEEAINIHYEKHHKEYFNAIKDSLLGIESIEEALVKFNNSSDIRISNFLRQIYNHNLYWQSLDPENGGRKSYSGSIIEFEVLKEKIISAGMKHFGSGWIWINRNEEVVTTSNADIPNGEYVLVIDIWEHAYYIGYKNDKRRFLEQTIENDLRLSVIK